MIPFTKLGDLTLLTSGTPAEVGTAVAGTWYDVVTYTITSSNFKKNVVIIAMPYSHTGTDAAASSLTLNVRIYDNTDSTVLDSGNITSYNDQLYLDVAICGYVGELIKKDHEIKIQVSWATSGVPNLSTMGVTYAIWTDK